MSVTILKYRMWDLSYFEGLLLQWQLNLQGLLILLWSSLLISCYWSSYWFLLVLPEKTARVSLNQVSMCFLVLLLLSPWCPKSLGTVGRSLAHRDKEVSWFSLAGSLLPTLPIHSGISVQRRKVLDLWGQRDFLDWSIYDCVSLASSAQQFQ